MGTNFYFCDENDEQVVHIGKRSAAGLYCWECGLTLCAGGPESVHEGETRWLDACPICGQKPFKENLADGAAGRELGFNKSSPCRKTGVQSCASFTWAISPVHFADLKDALNLHISDEYCQEIYDFSDILSECPIMFFDSIGTEFS